MITNLFCSLPYLLKVLHDTKFHLVFRLKDIRITPGIQMNSSLPHVYVVRRCSQGGGISPGLVISPVPGRVLRGISGPVHRQ